MGLKVFNFSKKIVNLISNNFDHRFDFARLEISFGLFSCLRTNQSRYCLWAQSYKWLIFWVGPFIFGNTESRSTRVKGERETGYRYVKISPWLKNLPNILISEFNITNKSYASVEFPLALCSICLLQQMSFPYS